MKTPPKHSHLYESSQDLDAIKRDVEWLGEVVLRREVGTERDADCDASEKIARLIAKTRKVVEQITTKRRRARAIELIDAIRACDECTSETELARLYPIARRAHQELGTLMTVPARTEMRGNKQVFLLPERPSVTGAFDREAGDAGERRSARKQAGSDGTRPAHRILASLGAGVTPDALKAMERRARPKGAK